MLAPKQITVDLNKYDIEKNFDAESALNDNNLIIAEPISASQSSADVVVNFRPNDTNRNPIYPYVGEVNGIVTYFDKNGLSKDGTTQIKIANSTINTPSSNSLVITRVSTIDPTETYTITLASLNFREQVALKILEKFLEKEENPYALSNSKIKLFTTRAFECAQEFINQSAEHREADTQVEEPIYKVQIVNDEESSNSVE